MTARGKRGAVAPGTKVHTLNDFQQHTGERVVYIDVATRQSKEVGIVSHVDSKWVYVHYEGSPGPLATHPNNLRLAGDQL
ncbi:hypothetical protein [Prescottella agglutinans]|uniref:Uncharacterized protein n=1 Tax=Prescottella agglutinans TaxID=1644129 RepID=A0ABT6M5A7_9NOCA|nr:hypothetical protein [Prescottella agglutinans]MDH6279487.1 hypothetical protein [Prescottella agglutinans]